MLALPSELIPADGRFGSGPSKIPAEHVAALERAAGGLLGTSHRKPTVKSLIRDLHARLAEYFRLPEGYEVALGNGGATLFWDAAAHGLIESRSAHAVFGEFSAKFAAVARAAPWLAEPYVAESPVGQCPHLGAVADADLYALTHCETSTGVVMAVRRPADDGLVAVDATSAAGAISVDPTQFDAYYFSPQKAFASEGGLWLALLSPAAIQRLEQIAASGRYQPAMLNLALALANSRADTTYNTPAIATLFLLLRQTEALLDAGGLDTVAAACAAKAGLVYDWAEQRDWATPFVQQADRRSPVSATVDLDASIPVDQLDKALRANGIVDVEGYRKLGRNQIRIATFPAIGAEDVCRLLGAVDRLAAGIRQGN